MKIKRLLITALTVALFPATIGAQEISGNDQSSGMFSSEEVSFTNPADGAVLSGTLLLPQGVEKPVVVLLVTGSGLQNRDEEIFKLKPFKDIAEYLASRGIASLRYDDRGFGKSTGSIDGATTDTFLSDAEAGVEFLKNYRSEPGNPAATFSKIGVAGHSEGGTIAFLLAADKKVDFIISLAGGAIQGKEAVMTQNYNAFKMQGVPEDQYGPVLDAIEEVFDKLIQSPEDEPFSKTMERIAKESSNPEIAQTLAMQLGNDSNGKWYKRFLALDPSDAISRITCPVMAVNGTLDFQVDCKENLDNLKKRLPASAKNLIKSYEGINHLLVPCKTGYPTEYPSLEGPVSEEIMKDIADWILGL